MKKKRGGGRRPPQKKKKRDEKRKEEDQRLSLSLPRDNTLLSLTYIVFANTTTTGVVLDVPCWAPPPPPPARRRR
jgi:hypothetical protein